MRSIPLEASSPGGSMEQAGRRSAPGEVGDLRLDSFGGTPCSRNLLSVWLQNRPLGARADRIGRWNTHGGVEGRKPVGHVALIGPSTRLVAIPSTGSSPSLRKAEKSAASASGVPGAPASNAGTMPTARAGPDMAAGVAYFTRSLETGLAPDTLDLRGLIACAPRDRGGGGRGLAHPAPGGPLVTGGFAARGRGTAVARRR
jgi:hypothetical protein